MGKVNPAIPSTLLRTGVMAGKKQPNHGDGGANLTEQTKTPRINLGAKQITQYASRIIKYPSLTGGALLGTKHEICNKKLSTQYTSQNSIPLKNQ